MKIRRIVTGHDAKGNSVFVSDGDVPRAIDFKSIPGHSFAQVWSTPAAAEVPATGGDPTVAGGAILPGPGGTTLLIVSLPPDAVMISADPAEAGPELGAALPGFIENFELDCPGMHTTDTIDYGIVLEGELWLELDNGVQKQLGKGDIVVQNGTRHAWRNKTDRVATAAFVLVGAARKA